MVYINSEDFKLTEANRTEILQRAEKLKKLAGTYNELSFFISKPCEKSYQFTIKLDRGKDHFTAVAHEYDFHTSLTKAKQKMVRQLSDANRNHNRSKQTLGALDDELRHSS